MRDMEAEIRQLLEKSQRTRYQFLKVELETCFTALDMAKYELSVGGTTFAVREIAVVEKGIATLEYFLAQLPPGDPRQDVEQKIATLKERFELIKAAVADRRDEG